MRTLVACCLFAVAALVATPACAQDAAEFGAAAQIEMYQDAVAAFREHRFSAAYGRFMRLADVGHEAAAEMALMMYRYGPTLFGAEWEATDLQLARWSEMVVAVERESAEFLRLSSLR